MSDEIKWKFPTGECGDILKRKRNGELYWGKKSWLLSLAQWYVKKHEGEKWEGSMVNPTREE